MPKRGGQAFNEHSAHGGDIYSLVSHVWVERIRFGGCFGRGGAGLLYLAQLLIRDDVEHDVVRWPAVRVRAWTVEAGRERRETRTVMPSLARSHGTPEVHTGEEYPLARSRRAKEGLAVKRTVHLKRLLLSPSARAERGSEFLHSLRGALFGGAGITLSEPHQNRTQQNRKCTSVLLNP